MQSGQANGGRRGAPRVCASCTRGRLMEGRWACRVCELHAQAEVLRKRLPLPIGRPNGTCAVCQVDKLQRQLDVATASAKEDVGALALMQVISK